MQLSNSQIEQIKQLKTPCYLYDTHLLEDTLQKVKEVTEQYNFEVHYALKANYNKQILRIIAAYGLGADCVSGNEILRALECGFSADKIVFAGVGKSDEEIEIAIKNNVLAINCESVAEIAVIDTFAAKHNKTVNIAIRINPNIDALTHKKITTGLNENKFGIDEKSLPQLLEQLQLMPNINLSGIHFHIGSQITQLDAFRQLAQKTEFYANMIEEKGFSITHLNMGGGLGINYEQPKEHPIANFEDYFSIFKDNLPQKYKVHFELGRSIVAQCGALISKVLYIKDGVSKKFAIIDAGMNDLLRPALYDAIHKIEVLTPHTTDTEKYDVVGPVCESSDVFDTDTELPILERGHTIAILSAGAYGDVMSSNYNLRETPKSYFLKEL